MNVDPPVFSDGKRYEQYKKELLAWKEITNVEKMGIVVALSLPEQGKHALIRERVFEELSKDCLKDLNGFEVLLAFLDNHLGMENLVGCREIYEDFDDFKRVYTQSIKEYISEFDKKYENILKKNMALSPEMLVFKLLKGANLKKEEQDLVLSGINFKNKANLYENVKTSLKKFKGAAGIQLQHSNGISKVVKTELMCPPPAELMEMTEHVYRTTPPILDKQLPPHLSASSPNVPVDSNNHQIAYQQQNPMINPNSHQTTYQQQNPMINSYNHQTTYQQQNPVINPYNHQIDNQQQNPVFNPYNHQIAYHQQNPVINPYYHQIAYHQQNPVINPNSHQTTYHQQNPVINPNSHQIAYQQQNPVINPYNHQIAYHQRNPMINLNSQPINNNCFPGPMTANPGVLSQYFPLQPGQPNFYQW